MLQRYRRSQTPPHWRQEESRVKYSKEMGQEGPAWSHDRSGAHMDQEEEEEEKR